jgi:cation diffusion facilitator CzcD-associated flavoprotein CzcO
MRHYVRDRTKVAIIGAGPYGLSIAAHLRARGVEFRIFGLPMHSWQAHMPSDMFLKSEGFASNLYAPQAFPLKRFCGESGLPYKYMGLPVSRHIFVAYGLAFQQRFVPNLEKKTVMALNRSPIGWQLSLDSGETAVARDVVVAVGLSHFQYVPPVLANLTSEFLSHSCDHSDLSMFRDRDVTVIGGGASACDVAASLHTSGAQVRLIARQPTLRWTKPEHEPLWGRLYPPPGLGTGGGWRSRFFENFQLLFRRLPEERRLRIVRTHLGPRAGWPVKDIIDRLRPLLSHALESAEVHDCRVRLVLTGKDGNRREVLTNHIIAATGFRVDVRKLTFLDDDVRSEIRTVENTPILSDHFESSVPGLYFTGLAAANTFGPTMRFVLGARFAARNLARHFARCAVR